MKRYLLQVIWRVQLYYPRLRLFVRRRIDFEAAKEDLHRLGVILIAAGFFGFIVSDDKVTGPESFWLVIIGLVVWFAGLYKGA